MSTLIVTSVVVVYAVASMAYVASSEQRAMRYRRRDRGFTRPQLPRPALSLPEWLQAPSETDVVEFIRPAPIEFEPTGPWHRVRSSAALVVLLTLVGAIVAIVVGLAAVVTVVALKNAAG